MTQTDRRAKFAGEIRAELGRQNRSVADLVRWMNANGARISQATMGRRLSGLYPFWVEELEAIASFLDISYEELSRRTDSPAERSAV